MRIVSVTITRQRLAKRPFEPRCRTPSIPDCGLNIERCALVHQDKVAAVFVRFLGEDVEAEEIRAWEGEVAEVETADGEEGCE